MPDAGDFATDLQLKAADDFSKARLAKLADSITVNLNGRCICGETIPPARLAAMPGTYRCTRCQAKAERLGVLYGCA
ncbi:TraR/DksA C4-type zinc finger protein [Pseudomonas sp. MWU12-2345]|uniref:TraR/DksA C4-type zinc finger protein n=1 Tax=Pseudomonas sp. MWU12-2345 TaxID=2928689 RepID=UPI00200FCC57|nr:TraR/DksA C4-type zinc finger protein [Pseudomonas sp. MWU12-2345]